MSRPKVGDRNHDGRTLEWTGDAWAPVCSVDDIPMTGHDEIGWLCCSVCGLRAIDDKAVTR